MATDRVNLKCGKCGSTQFRLPEHPKPADPVTCTGCGATSRYDRLQADAVKEVTKHVEDLFKKTFKKWN